MNWEVITSTVAISGSSTMGANTALSRAGNTIGTGYVLTGFQIEEQLSLGAGSTTYNDFSTGQFLRASGWIWGLSWVPTGDTVPNLQSAPDDAHFIHVGYNERGWDRQTINTAGSPAYTDLFAWRMNRKGRMQIPTAPGGIFYWHVANLTSVSVVTEWSGFLRLTFAQA